MPYLHIDLERSPAPDVRRRLAQTLGRVYGDVMQTDPRIVNVAFRELGAGNVVRLDGMGDSPRPITIVSCDVRRGRTAEQRTDLGRSLATAIARELDVGADRVIVYITEHDATEIYRDGGAAPEWRSDEAARAG